MKQKEIKKYSDDEDVVTKGYLRSTLYEFGTKLKNEIKEELKLELNDDFQRYIGALMEDNQHKHEQLIESFRMQYEVFLRYTSGNEEDKQKIYDRINRLESRVLLS